MANGVNIRVSEEVHAALVEHLKNTERKMGKWAEIAILEKIKKEKDDSSRINEQRG